MNTPSSSYRLPHRITRMGLVSTLATLVGSLTAADITIDVDTLVDEVTNPATTSLREAVFQAQNSYAGSDNVVINLPAGIYSLTQVGGGVLGDIDFSHGGEGSLTIRGAGGAATIIDADAINDRAFDVQLGEGGSVTIERMTIRNGRVTGADGDDAPSSWSGASGESGNDATGGGIRVQATTGNLTLRDLIIENCSATGGAGGDGADSSDDSEVDGGDGGWGGNAAGGGVFLEIQYTNATIERVLFDGNSVTGGVGGNGGKGFSASGSSASGGEGGGGGGAYGAGLAIEITDGEGEDLVLKETVFRNNSGTGGLGGIGGSASSVESDDSMYGGQGGSGGEARGGGLNVDMDDYNISLTVTNLEATNNQVHGGAGGLGGAITANSTWSCTGYGGRGGGGGDAFGGGMEVYATNSSADIIIEGASLTGNSATGGLGGVGGSVHGSNSSAWGSYTAGDGGSGGAALGGGIYTENFNFLRLRQATITGNTVTGGDGNAPGTFMVTDSFNSADGGSGGDGGDAFGGGIVANYEGGAGYLQIDGGVLVSGNSAIGGDGADGGMNLNNLSGGDGGDAPDVYGGGVYGNLSGHITFTRGGWTVEDNTAVAGDFGLGIGEASDGSSGESGDDDMQDYGTPDLIDGFAWKNVANAGYLAADDVLLPNVKVVLSDSSGYKVGELTTDSVGAYAFDTLLAGTSNSLSFELDGATGLFSGETDSDLTSEDDVDAVYSVSGEVGAGSTYLAGYGAAAPQQVARNLTITGKVSSDVVTVSIGSTQVTPSLGNYSISVDLAPGQNSVEMVTWSSDGTQSSRRLNLSDMPLGGS